MARNTKSLRQKHSQRAWEVIIKDKLAHFSSKSNCADHKENLNEPRGRLAWLFWAMYKLASCSSYISKYSCLALFSPLASLCLPSLASSPFFPLPSPPVDSILYHLAFYFLLFFPFSSSFSSCLYPSPPLRCAGFLQISWCKSSCFSTMLYWLQLQSNRKLID